VQVPLIKGIATKTFMESANERNELVHVHVISEPEPSGASRSQISVFVKYIANLLKYSDTGCKACKPNKA
jgi:hypothetical protein